MVEWFSRGTPEAYGVLLCGAAPGVCRKAEFARSPEQAGPHRKVKANCLIIQVGKLRLGEGNNFLKVGESAKGWR